MDIYVYYNIKNIENTFILVFKLQKTQNTYFYWKILFGFNLLKKDCLNKDSFHPKLLYCASYLKILAAVSVQYTFYKVLYKKIK